MVRQDKGKGKHVRACERKKYKSTASVTDVACHACALAVAFELARTSPSL